MRATGGKAKAFRPARRWERSDLTTPPDPFTRLEIDCLDFFLSPKFQVAIMSHGDDEFLARVIGASKLIDLYGYWISFHDAVVESVSVERVGPTVTIHFTTCDMVSDGEEMRNPDQQANVIIRWYGVKEMSFQGIDPGQHNGIDGLAFSAQGADIKSVIERRDALHGFIIAERAEVLEVVPLSNDPMKS